MYMVQVQICETIDRFHVNKQSPAVLTEQGCLCVRAHVYDVINLSIVRLKYQ